MSAAIVAQLPGIEAGRLADGRTRPDWPVASADLMHARIITRELLRGLLTAHLDLRNKSFHCSFGKSHNGPVPFRAPVVAGIGTVFRSLLYP